MTETRNHECSDERDSLAVPPKPFVNGWSSLSLYKLNFFFCVKLQPKMFFFWETTTTHCTCFFFCFVMLEYAPASILVLQYRKTRLAGGIRCGCCHSNTALYIYAIYFLFVVILVYNIICNAVIPNPIRHQVDVLTERIILLTYCVSAVDQS